MKKHLTVIFGLIISLGIFGCSTTSKLDPEDQLYTGMRKIKFYDKDNSQHAETTISNIENVLNASPNNSFMGGTKQMTFIPPIGLWMYNKYVDDSTGFGKWMFKRFATKPITIKSVNPKNRCLVAKSILNEAGYFHGSTNYEILTNKRNPKKAEIKYYVTMGPAMKYGEIMPLNASGIPDSIKTKEWNFQFLKPGAPFSIEDMKREREAISSAMRNDGFYFINSDAIIFQVDTLIKTGFASVKTTFRKDLPKEVFHKWQTNKISIVMNGLEGQTPNNEINYKGLKVRFYGKKPPVRLGVLRQHIRFKEGKLYTQFDEDMTRQALARLGAFGGMEYRFIPDTQDSLTSFEDIGKLNISILASQDKPWDASLEGSFKIKSNNYMGPGLRFSMAKRNVFGGGEKVSFDIYGSYELQAGHRQQTGTKFFDMNSYEVGTSLNFTFPNILWPGLTDRYYFFPTTTNFQLSSSMLNRAGFFSMVNLGLNAMYEFQPHSQHKHTIYPIKLNYNLMQHKTQKFEEILQDNPALRLSLRSQLIPQMSYTYTYDNYFSKKRAHHIWFELGFSQAGNIINALYSLGPKRYNETKKILGVPFSQFVKATAEVRYTFNIDRNQAIATRLGAGAIYAYGNMDVAPYSEQFYVGGANSIRAFTVRSIGPGKYIPNKNNKYGFLDQSGDIKLEFNTEYRFRLIGDLYGALFVDAGNIWLLRKDINRPGGSISEINGVSDFFKQIALGTGTGFRYDLTFLVVRLDFGYGLHLPYDTGKKGYFNVPKFKDGFGIHIAIGYPF